MFRCARLALVVYACLWTSVGFSQVTGDSQKAESKAGSNGADSPGTQKSDDTVQEAGRLYRIGLLQFEGKEFSAAAETFLRALMLDPSPVLAYNAARAFENDGDQENARRYYRRTLDLEPDEKIRVRAQNSLHRLKKAEESLREKIVESAPQMGTVTVRSELAATVTIDGQPHGQTPLSLELDPGTYQVRLTREGFEPYEQIVEVSRAAEVVVVATLEEHSTQLAWIGGGVVAGGVALAGVGAVFALNARADFEEAQGLEAQRDRDLFATLREDGEQAKLIATVFYGVATVAVLAGATMVGLWLYEPDPAGADKAGSAGVSFGFSPDEVNLRWTW